MDKVFKKQLSLSDKLSIGWLAVAGVYAAGYLIRACKS